MKHYIVVAATLLAAAILPAPAAAQADQGAFLRDPANYTKGSFQHEALAKKQKPLFSLPQQPGQTVRAVARQLEPQRVEQNTRAVIRAPLDLGRMIFDGVDRAGRFLINRKGRNYTGFTCLQCGREQRLVNIAAGFRDCAMGDVTYGWKHPACSTPAPAGAINSLRIWHSGQHIERVVGNCDGGLIAVADGNGPGGVNSVRCVPVAGATYHYPIAATGDPKLDGPFYMQPDPCGGRGRNPVHVWAAPLDGIG